MIIRNATPDDLSLILSLIQKKIGFDPNIATFSEILRLSEYRVHQILSGSIPVSYVLLSQISGRLVGFAFYEFRYSLFVGKPSIWLDELYVDEEMRSQGIGVALMLHLAQIAQEHNCGHLSWYADDRNTRSLSFYERLGAEITDQKGNRCFFVWTL